MPVLVFPGRENREETGSHQNSGKAVLFTSFIVDKKIGEARRGGGMGKVQSEKGEELRC